MGEKRGSPERVTPSNKRKAFLNRRSIRDRNPSEFRTQPVGEEEGSSCYPMSLMPDRNERRRRRKVSRDGGRGRLCFFSPCRDLNMNCCEGERRRSVWDKKGFSCSPDVVLTLHDPRGTIETSWNTNRVSLFFCVRLQGNTTELQTDL